MQIPRMKLQDINLMNLIVYLAYPEGNCPPPFSTSIYKCSLPKRSIKFNVVLQIVMFVTIPSTRVLIVQIRCSRSILAPPQWSTHRKIEGLVPNEPSRTEVPVSDGIKQATILTKSTVRNCLSFRTFTS